MADSAESRDYAGAMVAFEGPIDLVSTQLRLLPTSPQISILPSVETYLENEEEQESFDARRFIRKMHAALVSRNDIALGFLKDSTTQHKRLVFMNGGAPGVSAACIRAIAEHETHGDMATAQEIFEGLVKNGLAGLSESSQTSQASTSPPMSPDLLEQDPTYRAMRAADALDRLTANLQPNTDVDLAMRRRPRSMSLPMYSFDDRFGDAAPFYVFGTQSGVAVDDEDDESLMPPQTIVSPTADTFHEHFATRLPDHLSSCGALAHPPTSPSCVGEAYGPPTPRTNLVVDMLSPRLDTIPYHLKASEPLVFGRASVVQVMASGRRRPLKRTRSLDRVIPCSTQYRDTVLRMQARLSTASTAGGQDLPADRRRHSSIDTTSSRNRNSLHMKRASLAEPTRTLYVRTEQPIIALSPAPLKKRLSSVYVDRGTDAGGEGDNFVPVIPFKEDLVINFQDATCDRLLESIIQSYKTGTYPLKPSSPAAEPEPESPVKDDDSATTVETTADSPVIEPIPSSTADPDDYDPFAYAPKPAGSLQIPTSALVTPLPPTPIRTPTPSQTNFANEDKFHVCNVVDCKTAVAMQNDLRYILNIYFPSEDAGYHHFHFSLLPDMGGMWKPIFRETDDDTSESGTRRIDQILAVGAERGVQRAYVSSMTAQLERLGSKMGEVSRSGRLDFRYLVANAMQTFTAQPLSNQTRDNPFTNTYLLATLIIPHLETYFVTNNEVRFLILDYPPDHLPTILALQRLVGVDLMKVAQVVDANGKEPLPFTHIRGPSITRTPIKEDGKSKPSSPSPSHRSHSQQDSVSITKANFLLTSTASEAEVAKFIATIRKLLVEVSPYYTADDNLPKRRLSRRNPTPLSGTFSAFPRASMMPQSPPLSPSPAQAGSFVSRSPPPRPSSPASSVQTPPSLSDTVKTSRSGRSRRGRSSRKSDTSLSGGGGADDANNTALYIANDDDSDFDLEERRLMPIFDEKPRPRKGNSHKALKFLGLA
ncbi:hypothetical protein F5X68DRAFT_227756 [Plectosphaerella plurivora]|uniref:Gastric mucin-like protein n=1 Tax=Plectosphaerella plurivora TaxID=936078 RepID=A0A9P9AG03_9PEZI|nr:hypothetical protein F5X68DRAFT_227756 [Plectosphaerella plurivora]